MIIIKKKIKFKNLINNKIIIKKTKFFKKYFLKKNINKNKNNNNINYILNNKSKYY